MSKNKEDSNEPKINAVNVENIEDLFEPAPESQPKEEKVSENPSAEKKTEDESMIVTGHGEISEPMKGNGAATVYICPKCGSVYAEDMKFCPQDGATLVNIGTAESVWRSMSQALRDQIIADVLSGDLSNPKEKKPPVKERVKKWGKSANEALFGNASEKLMKRAGLYMLIGWLFSLIIGIAVMLADEFSAGSVIWGIIITLALMFMVTWLAVLSHAVGRITADDEDGKEADL